MILQILWLGVCVLLIVAILEIGWPHVIKEGFESVMSVGSDSFWSQYIPRRGDIGLDPAQEEAGYYRDTRYFSGYADVQRLGQNQDFCRMLTSKTNPKDMFFACALGGTDHLSSTRYRTKSKIQGLVMSRDDYMNDLGDGRDSYCRIIKTDAYTFQARCNPAQDEKFRDKMTGDSNPPKQIEELLYQYDGILFWLRLYDDMVDYAQNLTINTTGNITIDEAPPIRLLSNGDSKQQPIARTLVFNGIDQYLRIGDNKDLEFGNTIDLRYMRSFSCWVYFDEFTNNAHLFDFGNGAGKDNVFLGIVRRGSESIQSDETIDRRSLLCDNNVNSVMPDLPSGPQRVDVVTPEELMKTTAANVDEFTCKKPEIYGRTMPPVQPPSVPPKIANMADLAYEIWDSQQRKLRIQVSNFFPLRKWTHIAITATTRDAVRPDLEIYKDGVLAHKEVAAWLPQNTYLTHNYIGKSNWISVTDPYENADELFKGAIFDMRAYQTPMPEKKVKLIYKWGKDSVPTIDPMGMPLAM